jgi:GNAT superfamily N-acetyltransferase
MEVRLARIGDERAIAAVHVHTWQAAYRAQVPDAFLDSLSIERRTQGWSQIIAQSAPPAAAFVLEEGGQVVGFAHIAPSRDQDASGNVGELTAIYVSRAFWGTGAGTLLLERALAGLREAGFSRATLWVLETNRRARRFYESADWEPDGATKVDKRDGFQLHEVRYRRDLHC